MRVYEAKRYIVTDLSENESGYDLKLAEYAEEIYQTGKIGERQSSILNGPPMVFSDQQRNEMQLILDAIRDQTAPQAIDQIARDITVTTVAERTPRYRGKTYTLDNSGTVNGNIMNINDRILYLGPTEGVLVQNRVYRWLGDSWEMLLPPTESNRQNAFYYLEANGDVTDVAPEAVFSLAQVRSLVASSIFANLIGAKNIILNADGSIQSEDYVPGVSVFIIRADGYAEFNDGKFRGRIEANSGILNNITILENALFQGNISSGPLIVSAQAADDTPLKSYPVDTTPFTIYYEAAVLFKFDPSIQTRRSFAIVGIYNNRSINFIEFWLRNGTMYPLLEITVFFEEGGSEIVARHFQGGGSVYPPFNLRNSMSYRKAIFVGKTLRLVNIPTTKQETGSGILWRDGDTLKIS